MSKKILYKFECRCLPSSHFLFSYFYPDFLSFYKGKREANSYLPISHFPVSYVLRDVWSDIRFNLPPATQFPVFLFFKSLYFHYNSYFLKASLVRSQVTAPAAQFPSPISPRSLSKTFVVMLFLSHPVYNVNILVFFLLQNYTVGTDTQLDASFNIFL